ncbi:MAG: putative metalloprotease CJM1_0395 family protein [Pseudomonadota bacterium]|nr:putative metalloprotease CJM1_0395 family protein [Pseudomonadota bacterium]
MVPQVETARPTTAQAVGLNKAPLARIRDGSEIRVQKPLLGAELSINTRNGLGSTLSGGSFSKLDKDSLAVAQEAQDPDGEQIGEYATALKNKVDFNAEGKDGLTDAERRKVEALKARDRQVREHERAHQIAGGHYASSPTYRTVRGPDGKSYAVGGEVRIDTSVVPNNPEATIRKMQTVKRAALAPQEPSSADRAVAAEADAKIVRARQEIQERKIEEAKERKDEGNNFVDKDRNISDAQKVNGDLIFNPEGRFKGDPIGVGVVDHAALIGLSRLPKGHGVLDPGQLFSLIA